VYYKYWLIFMDRQISKTSHLLWTQLSLY
jgi:hypothetical protein